MAPSKLPKGLAPGADQESPQNTGNQPGGSGSQASGENNKQGAVADREGGGTVTASASVRRRLSSGNPPRRRLIAQTSCENGEQQGDNLIQRVGSNGQTNERTPLPNSPKRKPKRSRVETNASESGRPGVIPPGAVNRAGNRRGVDQVALADSGSNQLALAGNIPGPAAVYSRLSPIYQICSYHGKLDQVRGTSDLVFGGKQTWSKSDDNFARVMADTKEGYFYGCGVNDGIGACINPRALALTRSSRHFGFGLYEVIQYGRLVFG